MSDFWAAIGLGADKTASNMDQFLSGAVDKLIQPKRLTELKASQAVTLPVETGSRVTFAASLDALLTYETAPADKTAGVIVTVKTATGNCNAHEGRVFVAFQDGTFGAFYPQHLRYDSKGRTANAVVRRVASLGDLSGFLMSKEANDELIHKATQDLWSFRKDGGQYVIERLFDGGGQPLKG